MTNDKQYNKMIHTNRWLKLRRSQLTKHPLCQDCEEKGKIEPAAEVHHVTPVSDKLTNREKEVAMFDPYNLRSLCHACHVERHKAMGRSGKAHAKRQREEQLKQFVKKFL